MNYPTHIATHDLPISSGFSVEGGSISVYCGRCGGFYAADPYWAHCYLARIASQLRRELERDCTTRIAATRAIDDYVKLMRGTGLEIKTPEL